MLVVSASICWYRWLLADWSRSRAVCLYYRYNKLCQVELLRVFMTQAWYIYVSTCQWSITFVQRHLNRFSESPPMNSLHKGPTCSRLILMSKPGISRHGLNEWVSRVLRLAPHIAGHFGDESFQAITCTGIDILIYRDTETATTLFIWS